MRDRNFSTVIAADQMPVEAYSSILNIDDRWTGCNEVKCDKVDEESEAVSWVASVGSARAHDVVVDGEPVSGVGVCPPLSESMAESWRSGADKALERQYPTLIGNLDDQ
jgi:hypothetical protein